MIFVTMLCIMCHHKSWRCEPKPQKTQENHNYMGPSDMMQQPSTIDGKALSSDSRRHGPGQEQYWSNDFSDASEATGRHLFGLGTGEQILCFGRCHQESWADSIDPDTQWSAIQSRRPSNSHHSMLARGLQSGTRGCRQSQCDRDVDDTPMSRLLPLHLPGLMLLVEKNLFEPRQTTKIALKKVGKVTGYQGSRKRRKESHTWTIVFVT